MMVLIVIMMSAIVFIWVVPTFQSNTGQDNSGAAYAEKFSTIWGNFATFAPSIPETVYTCTDLSYANIPSGMCPLSNPIVTCNTSITSPTTSNILVPVNGACLITASVGNDYQRSNRQLLSQCDPKERPCGHVDWLDQCSDGQHLRKFFEHIGIYECVR